MSELQRYGLEWKSETDFVCHPMADGYWTPWHIATEEVTRLQSEVERLRGRVTWFEEWRDRFIDACDANPRAWLLIKQAEAVDAVIKRIREARYEVDKTSVEESDTACTLRIAESIAISEAQRLRQQAAESENDN